MSKKRNAPRKGNKAFAIGRSRAQKYTTFEEMWAENGVINIRGFDGKVTRLTTGEAASRAVAVNRMLGSSNVPNHERKKFLNFVEKAIEVIRSAKAQQETPTNAETKVISNVIKGRTAEGKEMPKLSREEKLVRLQMQYPCLDKDEIINVMSATNLDVSSKMEMMSVINQDRSMQRMVEAQAIMAKKAQEKVAQAVAEIDGLGDS